jgi:hypothetical protein
LYRDSSQQDLFTDAPVWDEGLTGRRKKFVELYCKSKSCFLSPAKAYAEAFTRNGIVPSEKSIQSNSSRMMKDPKIKDAIKRLLRSHQDEEDQLTEYEVLRALKILSLTNPKDIVEKDNYGKYRVKELDELGELALCINEIKNTKHGQEIKLYDRTKSLSMLCSYLDITRPEEGKTIINPVIYLADKEVEALKEKKTQAISEDAEYEVMGTEELTPHQGGLQ